MRTPGHFVLIKKVIILPKKLVIYIHGKDGSASEADHYSSLFCGFDVIGFDYISQTPKDAQAEFCEYFDAVSCGYDRVYLIANSIGAYYALCSLSHKRIDKAFFISPIVNMEKLISDMMIWANVNEDELFIKKEIKTDFGEILSWEYLNWVRNHQIEWNIPTEILYGSDDDLQSLETINGFSYRYGANVTVMDGGEHWFHTERQIEFLDKWIKRIAE